MSLDYNIKTKKESVVSGECLQTLEAKIINNINSLKDEIISLKDMVIKRLQENKTPSPLFFAKAALNLQTVQALLFRQLSQYIGFSLTP